MMNNKKKETHQKPFSSSVVEMTPSASSAAVFVRNASKCYDNGVPVLQQLSMTVPQGSIYGLLGASGCGKTTILSCIVGIRKLDSGDVYVFGQKPGSAESGIPGRSIGYMPQDIALYTQLTIKETLQYFGRIYNMNSSEVEKREEFLTNFLNLPPSFKTVGNLSGGEQRRVSLATCLLHEPPLLILDEPTVGVDPLLRQNIWTHLGKLVSEKQTTVIITTHYIEEARQSDMVGLMRNGKLLAENRPDTLLQEHNTLFLEDIVLKLCRTDRAEFEKETVQVKESLIRTSKSNFYSAAIKTLFSIINPNQVSVVGLKYNKNVLNENNSYSTDSTMPHGHTSRSSDFNELCSDVIPAKLKRIQGVVVKNALILLRSPLFLVFLCFFPSINVILVNKLIGPEPKTLNFGIVSPEVGLNLSVCQQQSNKLQGGCWTDSLSCEYLNTLPSDLIVPVTKASVEEALADLQNGRLWGYMSFPNNFSRHTVDRAVGKMFSSNETVDGSVISFQLDMSQYITGALLTRSFYQSYQSLVQRLLSNCGEDPKIAELGMNFRTPIYGKNDPEFQEFLSPAVLILLMFCMPFLSCAYGNLMDRTQGTLERSMVAGLTMTDILAGFILTEGFIVVLQALISYIFVVFVFQVEVKGSVVAFIMLCILTGVAGVSIGFLTAQLCEQVLDGLVIAVAFYPINLFWSGVIWPLDAFSVSLRYFSYCLPCTWTISAVRSILSRGWSWKHHYVFPGYAVLLIWIAVTWGLAIAIAHRRTK